MIKVYIEKSSDGFYSAYLEDTGALPFGAYGEGATAEEAKSDFLKVTEAYKEEGYEVPDASSFEFQYDVPSFLQYYRNAFTLAGLEKITGVAQGQLSHYLNGVSRPNAKTTKKIQNALHSFGQDLMNLRLI